MSTIIDQTPDIAATETVVPTGVRHPVVGHDDVMYRVLPFHISIAAVRAVADGAVKNEEFPASTGDWIADGIAMRTFLDERGLWDAYRQELAQTSFVADCPGWCATRHQAISADNMVIVHELPMGSIVLDDDTEVSLSIQGFQDSETVGQAKPYLWVDTNGLALGEVELTHRDAAQLAEAFTAASKTLSGITELLAGGAA